MFRRIYRKIVVFIKRWPLTSFFVVLGLLFLLIILGSFVSPKVKETEKKQVVKEVQVYQIGQTPKITLQAKIKKSGVIKITALAPGVVQSINFEEGDKVSKGSVLLNLSSNYQGGNAASIQRQLANSQFQSNKDNFDTQKEIIQKQKELAEKGEANASDLRSITDKSLGETRDLIDINQALLNTLSQNQINLENNNPGGIQDATILQIRGQRAQIQSGLNQLRQGLRIAEFQASGDKPPAEIARLQKETALKQLDLQQKALELGLEASRLQLILAQINESLFFPASPFSAIVQRVFVKEGEAVNPGTPLMVLSATVDPISAIVNLPQNLSSSVSAVEPSTLEIGDQLIDLLPTFISTEATDGTLYSILFIIPDKFSPSLVEGGNISITIPVGISQTNSVRPFIPLDSVFQTADKSIVLTVKEEKAISKEVKLGNVFGKFVEVKEGLAPTDQIILNRNVLSGEKVEILK